MNNSFFITGTDTHIGKTEITCGLIHFFKNKANIVCGMKPVAAGTEDIDDQKINEDVYKFKKFNSLNKSIEIINPYSFDEAIAPHIASNKEKEDISFQKIRKNFLLLQKECDYLFVEGAGGYRVPLSKEKSIPDLIEYLNIPIILVVGIRLGCINHTMLTVESINNNKHHLFGWVANCIDLGMSEVDENINYLVNNIEAPFMGKVPFLKQMNYSKISDHLIWPVTK